jgi:hypothetical protein
MSRGHCCARFQPRFGAKIGSLSLVASAAFAAGAAAEPAAIETAVEATAYYYALRDEPDLTSVVVAGDREALHLEARYNYEERDAGSAFLGWTFSGGDELSFEATPIVGVLFGSAHGLIPGLEASLAYGPFDASVEAEYVGNLDEHAASYFYTWDELGWSPNAWLRVGLAGQRTRAIHGDRTLERGLFATFTVAKAHFGVYAFNPDLDSRYVVAMFGVSF